jgi:hypothetical protein
MKVFIASSTESLLLARELAAWCEKDGLTPVVWEDPGVFQPGEFTYQSLLRISNDVQAAIILMNEDDKVWYRKEFAHQPRDNVFIEYGLFSARLGVKRAIIARSGDPKKASDLAGLNYIDVSNLAKRAARLAITNWATEILSYTKDNFDTSDQKCQADWRISERRARRIGVDIMAKDASNLFFALFCVLDCQRSRIAIGDLQAASFGQISIEAEYDLMGAWDLLIKFRAETNDLANTFYQEIVKTLASKQMMNVSESERFGKRQLVNVMAQSKTILKLLYPTNDEEISYILLPSNSDYDVFRASRAFIIVQARGGKGSRQRQKFLIELNRAIEDGVGKSIIESICEGESELVIETLSTCSQTNLIKKLNREIESILTIHELQKYTLSCYYHEESGLLANSNTVKGAV